MDLGSGNVSLSHPAHYFESFFTHYIVSTPKWFTQSDLTTLPLQLSLLTSEDHFIFSFYLLILRERERERKEIDFFPLIYAFIG